MKLPLYARSTDRIAHWRGGNTGLRFAKFADCWTTDAEKFFVFNAPQTKADGLAGDDWFGQFQGKFGDGDLLKEYAVRLIRMVTAANGVVIGLKNCLSRFVTGMGLAHPTENGFAFHHALGVPYLPGSGLKGVVRSYVAGLESEPEQSSDDAMSVADFGSADRSGRFIFTDMLPIKPVSLVTEVMTPHYSPYYQHGRSPGDWHSPNPIKFLCVDSDQSWVCGIIPIQAGGHDLETKLLELRSTLLDALNCLGAGGKTNSGFGYFEAFESDVESLRKQDAQARAEAEAAAAIAKQRAEAHPQVARLMELAFAWKPGDHQTPLTDIEQFLAGLAEEPLAAPAVEWLRVYFEGRQKGVWNDPDKRKEGKPTSKKSKKPRKAKTQEYVCKSERLRDLIKRVRQLAGLA